MTQFVCTIDETMMGEEFINVKLSRRKPPQKRDIDYGPAPKHLVEAIRKQLITLVNLPDLEDHLGTIGRFANQAEDVLMVIKPATAVMRAEHEITVPGAPEGANTLEAYGANVLRELISGVSNIQKSAMESPESLTMAIATARRHGMHDVAAALEKKLVGHTLDGARPVDGSIASYLAPLSPIETPEALSAGKKRRTKKGHLNGTSANATAGGSTP